VREGEKEGGEKEKTGRNEKEEEEMKNDDE